MKPPKHKTRGFNKTAGYLTKAGLNQILNLLCVHHLCVVLKDKEERETARGESYCVVLLRCMRVTEQLDDEDGRQEAVLWRKEAALQDPSLYL